MTYENANRTQGPEIDPLPPIPPGSNPPRYRDIDRIGKAGYMAAAAGALLIVTALTLWPGPTDRQAGRATPLIDAEPPAGFGA